MFCKAIHVRHSLQASLVEYLQTNWMFHYCTNFGIVVFQSGPSDVKWQWRNTRPFILQTRISFPKLLNHYCINFSRPTTEIVELWALLLFYFCVRFMWKISSDIYQITFCFLSKKRVRKPPFTLLLTVFVGQGPVWRTNEKIIEGSQ